ncbi:hypothetical protein [Thalassobellus suaedae]|uniref:Uncharacterized protein n=1 Tax=Thalassobellus suaedae TaxID=3074124 RepID=A0ABY9XQ18_9FLAO|nr:hypothetical protein RHP51_12580 [Flavobacteriaceae bacterium HL-DH14]
MKKRWYISTLVVILTVLGVVFHEQISVPNQEIVLQFANVDTTTNQAQKTIAIVKKQLQDLGVQNIQVAEIEKGSLRISYYSDTDVASIKKTFSKEKHIILDYAPFSQDKNPVKSPLNDDSFSYNIDVFEIDNGNHSDLGFNGKYVLEPKPKNDRFFNPNVYLSANNIDISEKDSIIKVAYKIRRNITITIDNALHKIPEVRALPIC